MTEIKLKHWRSIDPDDPNVRLSWGRSGQRVRIMTHEADGTRRETVLRFKASPIALEVCEAYATLAPGAEEDPAAFALRCARTVNLRYTERARAARDFIARRDAARWQAHRRRQGRRAK